MKSFCLATIAFILLSSCGSVINTNFEYQKSINPTDVRADLDFLKKSIEKHHYNINWENKKEQIFTALDQIGNINSSITLDSFENRISAIINWIDDGHSTVIHQCKLIHKSSNFGINRISNSIYYIRIANFTETHKLKEVLKNLKSSFEQSPTKKIIIDIRSNHGGSIENVNYFLSYFLPSRTIIYERMDVAHKTFINRIIFPMYNIKYNGKFNNKTGVKKLNGSAKIYLLIDDKIASGSMLCSYHLQRNGAYVLGNPPKGLFNSFGNPRAYKLPYSKIVYNLATARIFLSNQAPERKEDMLKPNYIPNAMMDLDTLIEFIEGL